MEHGNQGCYIEGHRLSGQYNLKFVFGAEAYWVKDRTLPDPTNGHIYIGARNENGRQCINDILSEANLTGFYRRPRIDIPLLLSLPKDDVIVTSACVAFWKYDDVEDIVRELSGHFGKNFFLEVQYHLTDAQKQLNQRILRVRDRLKIPIIMGCDSHYILPQQSQDRDDFLLSKGISYEDEGGWFLDYPDGDTAYDRFCRQGVLTQAQIDEAMSNTGTFLDVETYDSEVFDSNLKLPTLPRMKGWPQKQRDEAYKHTVWQGWERYKHRVPEELHAHYEAEIQSEIGGDGTRGFFPSEEHKEEIRDTLRKFWDSDERRKQLSVMRSAPDSTYQSDEFKSKIGKLVSGEKNPNYGHYWSDEMKDALREKRKESGRYVGELNPNHKAIRCVETGEVFSCIKYAKEKYGVKSETSFSIALDKPNRTAAKLHWVSI